MTDVILTRTISLLALIPAALLPAGCLKAVKPMPFAVPIQPANQYAHRTQYEGLIVAADPFVEQNRLNAFFGTDLLANGILPVLVVVENHHSQDSYSLSRDQFGLIAGQPGREVGVESDTDANFAVKGRAGKEKIAGVGRGSMEVATTGMPLMILSPLIPAALGIPGLLLQPVGAELMDANMINSNLTAKAFVDCTLMPGQSKSGFIYFRLNSREQSKHLRAIKVKVRNTGSEGEFTVDLRRP